MSRETVTKYVAIDNNLWEEFSKVYPSQGGLSWFVNACLEKFVALHETTVDERVEEIVNQIILDEG